MDAVKNSFVSDVARQSRKFSKHETILQDAHVAIHRALLSKASRSQMLLGLRGVGKTDLLNRIEEMAETAGHVTSSIVASDGKVLSELLVPNIDQALGTLPVSENVKATVDRAFGALRSFAATFNIAYGDLLVSVDAETGISDSGDIEADLSELFVRVGEAAKAAGQAWTLLIDDVQHLRRQDLAALIVALHKVNQRALPVAFFGAGLPQVAALSADAKPYAERLFQYSTVGALGV